MSLRLKGTLTVQVHAVRDLKNTAIIGKQDPYVSLWIGKTKFKTTIAKGAGKNAKWDHQEFTFNMDGTPHDMIHFRVIEDGTLLDTDIGRLDVPLSTFLSHAGRKWYDLVDRNNFKLNAGYVQLSATFTGTGGVPIRTKSEEVAAADEARAAEEAKASAERARQAEEAAKAERARAEQALAKLQAQAEEHKAAERARAAQLEKERQERLSALAKAEEERQRLQKEAEEEKQRILSERAAEQAKVQEELRKFEEEKARLEAEQAKLAAATQEEKERINAELSRVAEETKRVEEQKRKMEEANRKADEEREAARKRDAEAAAAERKKLQDEAARLQEEANAQQRKMEEEEKKFAAEKAKIEAEMSEKQAQLDAALAQAETDARNVAFLRAELEAEKAELERKAKELAEEKARMEEEKRKKAAEEEAKKKAEEEAKRKAEAEEKERAGRVPAFKEIPAPSGSPVISLSCGSAGKLFAATADSGLYSYNGSRWEKKPGGGVQATMEGNSVIVVNKDRKAYLSRDGGNNWGICNNGYPFTYVGRSNHGWLGIHASTSSVYQNLDKSPGWRQIPGPFGSAVHVDQGQDGTLWVVSPKGELWQRHQDKWAKLEGTTTQCCGLNAKLIYRTDGSNTLQRLHNGKWEPTKYKVKPGPFLSIGDDGTVGIVTPEGKILIGKAVA